MTNFLCPETLQDIVLPKNLLKHQRNVTGKWRYRGVDGLKCLTYYVLNLEGYIDTQTAIEAAMGLNEKYYGKDVITKRNIKGALGIPFWIEEHIKELILLDQKHTRNADTFRNKEYLLRAFARSFSHIPISALTIKMLKDWWLTTGDFTNDKKLSPSAQGNRRIVDPSSSPSFRCSTLNSRTPHTQGH